MRHAASHLGCTSQLHISVASLVWTSQFLLLLAPQCCTSYLHVLCTSAPFRCTSLSLDFQSQVLSSRLSCASRMASSTLPESWVEPRGRSCAQRSCEPETRCMLCGSSAFCMQQFGCSNLSLRIQGFSCLLSVFLNSA